MTDPEYLIAFTDDELNAIYDLIENAPAQTVDSEARLQRILDKITPAEVGDSRVIALPPASWCSSRSRRTGRR